MQPSETDLFGEPTRDLTKSQLFTPMWLARRMASMVPRTARVLEPSCGRGNLVKGLLLAGHPPANILAIDGDERMATFTRERFEGSVPTICADFLKLELVGFDFALMNPPYEENQHLEHILHALELVPALVALVPADFEFTQERDAKLWATKGVVTHRAILPERVKFTGDGGQNEHVVLRIARRMRHRRWDDERTVYEQTWRPGEGPLEHMGDMP